MQEFERTLANKKWVCNVLEWNQTTDLNEHMLLLNVTPMWVMLRIIKSLKIHHLSHLHKYLFTISLGYKLKRQQKLFDDRCAICIFSYISLVFDRFSKFFFSLKAYKMQSSKIFYTQLHTLRSHFRRPCLIMYLDVILRC